MTDDLIDAFYKLLIELDKCMAANDYNAALKKTHEAIAIIRKHKDDGN